VLYDLFERHATDYSPDFNAEEKQRYLEWLTDRLFERLNVRTRAGNAADHASEVWRVLGPSSLGVYPEVPRVLEALRKAGYPLSIVSNWQCGLAHFCHELGLVDAVDHIIASAEVRSVKPDPKIFRDACDRMQVSCDRVLHVGDSPVDDVEGAKGVGMQVVLIQRDGQPVGSSAPTIRSLDELVGLLV
jgi:putative hydrolase of the HAD superfamily